MTYTDDLRGAREPLLPGTPPRGELLAVRATGVSRFFVTPAGTVQVLEELDLVVRPGDSACVMGASGSGKSTLLNILGGLDDADGGSVQVLGRDLGALSEPDRARLRLTSIGMVFQDHGLVPDLTASENIEILLRAREMSAKTSRVGARDALAQVGLAGLEDRFPRQLSGGQQQRVGVARALAGGKELILADEPTGALDQKNSDLLFDLLAELATQHGVAIVVCTHDPRAAMFLSRTYTLVDGRLKG